MTQAADALRAKQRQAEARRATQAPGSAAEEHAVQAPADSTALAQTLATSELIDSYRDLVAISARTYGQLDKHDPVRAELLAAITHARQAWNQFLFEGTEELAQEIGQLPYAQPQPPTSVELVPVKPAGEMVAVTTRRRYPDEAALVRYVRNRRARHRWPDEAAIARYLRKRRERGPRYPDESGLSRYLKHRRQREL